MQINVYTTTQDELELAHKIVLQLELLMDNMVDTYAVVTLTNGETITTELLK
jgi:hypothetical protein